MPVIPVKYTRPPLYGYQTKILDSPARYTCTAAATKVGKTASHIVWLFEQALTCKANQSVWWVAPSWSQAKVAYDRMKVQLTDVNGNKFFKTNESDLLLTLRTGVKIQFKTGEKPDNLYGDDVYAIVVDEASRIREAAWFALRTTITATGGKMKFIGNVRGRKNWFYKMCVRAAGQDNISSGGNYEYFKITAYDAAEAGMITKDGRSFYDEIIEAKKDLPDSVFRELYLAEPSEDGSNPFGIAHIAGCVAGMSSKPAICFGVDLAKSVDFTAIVGLDEDGFVCRFDYFQKDWRLTTEMVVDLPRGVVVIDSTGVGDPISEDVIRSRPDVERFIFTQRSKQQIMEGLALAIQKRLIHFPDGIIRDQLESFEYNYTIRGVSYSAPSGEHDDAVCALALAWSRFSSAVVSPDGPSFW